MKEIGYITTGIVLGIFVGWFAAAIDHQDAWREGREDVLNSTVTVGVEDAPCAASIPLSVLAEMVNAGVMDWHRACKGADQ